MTTKVEIIQSRDYNLTGILSDEVEALEEFLDKSGYLCDAISETADSYIPIYNGDVWENASNISEYIEQAIEEGIAPTDGGNTDLIRIFQSGYYVYYQESLYNNLDTLAFNYVAEKVNEYLNGLTEEELALIDIDEIEDTVESETDSTDNNDRFDDLDDKAKQIITQIQDGEFVA